MGCQQRGASLAQDPEGCLVYDSGTSDVADPHFSTMFVNSVSLEFETCILATATEVCP